MLYDREIEAELRQVAAHFPVLVLTGARQTGKTTALKAIFHDYSYLSLDLPSLAEQAERDPESFFSQHQLPLIIDEVQYAPGLFRHIKALVDKDRHQMGHLILTGSQHFGLMKNVSDSLAGRVAIFELETLSLSELTAKTSPLRKLEENFPASVNSLVQFLCRGQFPELWRNIDLDSSLFYTSYLATYLERDLRQILNVVSLRDFERFIRVLASRSGAVLNKSDIAKDVGVSIKAIGDWISVLETSGQIILLEPWFSNFSKRIVRSPKLYFRDTGLLCYLLGLDETSLQKSPFLGPVWETFLFAELRKSKLYREGKIKIWYYRDQAARKIDFILERGGKLSFAEAKWTEHPDENDAKTMKALAIELELSSSPWRPGERFILSRAAHPFPLDDGTKILPFSMIGSLLQ